MTQMNDISMCAYCGEREMTQEDHVVPRALFINRGESVIKVPACDECNHAKSLDEDYLRDFLVMDASCSEHPVAMQLVDGKVARAWRKNHSQVARAALAHGEVIRVRTAGGVYLRDHIAVPIAAERIETALHLIVRGLYYHFFRLRFPDVCAFKSGRMTSEGFRDVWSQYAAIPHSGPYRMGDDVFGCAFLRAEEEPFNTHWLLWFYGGKHTGMAFGISTHMSGDMPADENEENAGRVETTSPL